MKTDPIEKIKRDIESASTEQADAEKELEAARATFAQAASIKLAIAAQCHIGKEKVQKLDAARRSEDMAQGAVSLAHGRVQRCEDRLHDLTRQLSDAQAAAEQAVVEETLAEHSRCGRELVEAWKNLIACLSAWRNFDSGAVREYRSAVGHYTPVGVQNETSYTVCALIAPILKQFPHIEMKYLSMMIGNQIKTSPDSPEQMLEQIVALSTERRSKVLRSIERPANGSVRRWSDQDKNTLPRFKPRARHN